MMTANNKEPAGNVFDKYHTQNPLFQILMRNFLTQIKSLILSVPAKNILEVGCGEGYLLEFLQPCMDNRHLEGMDRSEDIIRYARENNPHIKFVVGDVLHLPYADTSFDLVLASEVLEHIGDYKTALKEIKRVSRKYCLFSVPHEPIWRICNILRLKYVKKWGNTPGHVNHWSKSSFLKLLKGHFKISHVHTPFPWIMVLCQKD